MLSTIICSQFNSHYQYMVDISLFFKNSEVNASELFLKYFKRWQPALFHSKSNHQLYYGTVSFIIFNDLERNTLFNMFLLFPINIMYFLTKLNNGLVRKKIFSSYFVKLYVNDNINR